MRVFFLLHASNKYGAGRSVLAMIEGLVRRGVKCYCLLPEKGPLQQEFEALGVEYRILRLPRWVSENNNLPLTVLRLAVNFFLIVPIALMASRWRADLFFSTSSVIPAGAFAAFLSRKPHIWQIREFVEEDYQMHFDLGGDFSRKIIGIFSKKVIFVSKALSLKYSSFVDKHKNIVIYNQISLDNAEALECHPNIYGQLATLVGRIHPGKGQEEAVRAVSFLKKQGINLQLNIVGDGDAIHTNSLIQLVHEQGVDDRVRFFGFVSTPSCLIRSSNLLLVCSHSGALDRVVIEGMLCEVPVVVARGGGNQEVIDDGITGLLYTPGDYQDLALKIKAILENPKLARNISEKAKIWATEKFDGRHCSEKVFELLEETLTCK
ncbi:MAG: glycosyltransferase [Geobacter sp.]